MVFHSSTLVTPSIDFSLCLSLGCLLFATPSQHHSLSFDPPHCMSVESRWLFPLLPLPSTIPVHAAVSNSFLPIITCQRNLICCLLNITSLVTPVCLATSLSVCFAVCGVFRILLHYCVSAVSNFCICIFLTNATQMEVWK